jgi:hypothetical protein
MQPQDRENCQMVELLLARGADIGGKSTNSESAIELLSGHKRSTELLRTAMDTKTSECFKVDLEGGHLHVAPWLALS